MGRSGQPHLPSLCLHLSAQEKMVTDWCQGKGAVRQQEAGAQKGMPKSAVTTQQPGPLGFDFLAPALE